jgi:hypothetical protein
MLSRTISLCLVIAATLTLTGCFVASTHVPAGSGPVADRRLVGSWQGIDDGNHNPTSDDVVLTFQMTSNTLPLQLTWNEGGKRIFYDVYTRKFGRHLGFAAKVTGPAEAQGEDETKGAYYLGYYEFTSSGGLIFYLVDKTKLSSLIASGKLKGSAGKSEYDIAILNGPAREVGRFLASAKGFAARSEDPAFLRRLPAN